MPHSRATSGRGGGGRAPSALVLASATVLGGAAEEQAWTEYSGLTCTGDGLLRDFLGTELDCKAKCLELEGCAGFVRVHGKDENNAGKCFFRSGSVGIAPPQFADERTCYLLVDAAALAARAARLRAYKAEQTTAVYPGGRVLTISQRQVFWHSPGQYTVLDHGDHRAGAGVAACDPGDSLLLQRSAEEQHPGDKMRASLAYCGAANGTAGGGFERTRRFRAAHTPPFAVACEQKITQPQTTREVAEYWARYYTARGFEYALMYTADPGRAWDIPGVVWVVAPFCANTKYMYCQFYTQAHCLHLNKVWGTQWVLQADVDEFIAPLHDIRDVVGGLPPRHSLSFGTRMVKGMFKATKLHRATGSNGYWERYLAMHNVSALPLEGDTCSPGICRAGCDVCADNFGHRKQLLNVSAACFPFVHESQHDFEYQFSQNLCLGPGSVEHVSTAYAASVHFRGLGNYRCTHNPIVCDDLLLPDTHPAPLPGRHKPPSLLYEYAPTVVAGDMRVPARTLTQTKGGRVLTGTPLESKILN